MTLEALNTVLSAGTLLVIAATALAALVQLRHMRTSNQLNALVTVLQDWQKPELQAWVRFVRDEMPGRLEDPAYLREIDELQLDRVAHPWLHVADYYEQFGAYVKYGFVDKTSYLDVGAYTVSQLYRVLEPAIERMRRARNNHAVYENFEYLAVIGLQWINAHKNGAYPRGLPRFRDIDTGVSKRASVRMT